MNVLQTAILALAATMLVGCASHPVPARIMKDATTVSSCEFMGFASDTDYVDLARKAGEIRGTHAVIVREQPRQRGPLSSTTDTEHVAEVYRCSTGRAATTQIR
jgi:hypothetical protein